MDLNDRTTLQNTLRIALHALQKIVRQDILCRQIGSELYSRKRFKTLGIPSFTIIIVLCASLPFVVLLTYLSGLPFLCLAFFAYTIGIILAVLLCINNRKKIQEKQAELTKNVNILNQIIHENYAGLTAVPEAYRYTYAVSTMLSYVDAMRADSMKEAINLYEEELHRMRMEQGQQQIIAIQQEQQQTLASINHYSRRQNIISAANTAASVSIASSAYSINEKLE